MHLAPSWLCLLAALTACVSRRPVEPSAPEAVKLEGPPLWPAKADLSDSARKGKILELAPELEKSFAEYREKQKLPGLAIGIVVGDELIYAKGFGVSDLESQSPIDPETVFRIASMTKSFTGLAILKLRDEGKLSLEDPVSKYVPELSRFKGFTRDSPSLSIRELLSHSAGFPEDNAWADPRLDLSEQAFSSMLRRGLALSSSPGTQFEYSNLGFAIAGLIVQRVSGMRYQDYVTRQILRPLRMSATAWSEKEVPRKRLAKGYARSASNWALVRHHGPPEPVEHIEPLLGDGAFASIGGLFTSIRDYARYVSFQLSAWPARDDPETGPVRRSSVRESHQMTRHANLTVNRPAPSSSIDARAAGYGVGWGVSETCEFDRLITHGGGLPGFGSYVMLFPDQGVGIFAFANVTYAPTARLLLESAKTLASRGAMSKRRLPASQALQLAQMVALPLLERWDDSRADRLFDQTFFQYNPAERLRAELASLHRRHGSCWPVGEMVSENELRGQVQLECDRGVLEVELALTPDEPARLQWMEVTERLPPSDTMVKVAGRVVHAVADSRYQEAIDELLAPEVNRAKLHRELERSVAVPDRCHLRRWLDGDGANSAKFELACGQGPLQVQLTMNISEKIEQLVIGPLQDPRAKCPL